jgi:mycofactocin glycosyltransferase
MVDDASVPPLTAMPGHRTIRLSTNSGPAAARNAGLSEVATPLVAFVDTDVDLSDGWLDALLAHFSDPLVALVAPRVAARPGLTTLARYEWTRSPLDLGAEPARITAGTRVGYVPGAALLARADALRAIGGFDETLRYGEDVDMVWRLIGAGHRCRYEPAATVHHRPRSTLSAWVCQRMTYGRSAAALGSRHPGAVAPVRMSGWSAAVWALLLLRRPRAAAMVAIGTTAALHRKLDDIPTTESVRLAGLGHLYAGRQLACAITRVWWPLAPVVFAFGRRTRLPLIASAAVPPLIDWLGNRKLDPLRYAALHLADDVAYGTGVWIGAVEQRNAGALWPKLTNWPGRGAG